MIYYGKYKLELYAVYVGFLQGKGYIITTRNEYKQETPIHKAQYNNIL